MQSQQGRGGESKPGEEQGQKADARFEQRKGHTLVAPVADTAPTAQARSLPIPNPQQSQQTKLPYSLRSLSVLISLCV